MRSISLALATAAAGVLYAASAEAAVITLGTASDFALLTVPGSTQVVFSKGTINGDVGIGVNGYFNNTGSAGTVGTAYVATETSQVLEPLKVTGGVEINSPKVNTAINDAITGYNAIVAETATQQITGSITTATTITGTGGQNVIDISGNVVMNGGDAITLSGTANDWFILKIHGDLDLNSTGGIKVSGGVTADHVLISVIGTGNLITSDKDVTVQGTVLAPYRAIEFHSVSGAIYGGNGDNPGIVVQSGAILNHDPYTPAPEPAALGLLGVSTLALLMRRQRGKAQ